MCHTNQSQLDNCIFQGSLSEDDEYSRALTSFTLISLLELKNRTAEGSLMKNPKQLENFIENALSCLRLDEGEQRDKYTTALTTYALILAGRTQLARKSIGSLINQLALNFVLPFLFIPVAF